MAVGSDEVAESVLTFLVSYNLSAHLIFSDSTLVVLDYCCQIESYLPVALPSICLMTCNSPGTKEKLYPCHIV